MSNPVIIHFIWQGETISIPATASGVSVEYLDDAPIMRQIIGLGNVAIPSHAGLRMMTIENQQLVASWMRRNNFSQTPRQLADKLREVRKSNVICELAIETDYEPLQHNFDVLVEFNSWNVEAGRENDIGYSLVAYEYVEHGIKELEIVTEDGQETVKEPPPERPPLPPMDIDAIARRVIRGDFGNGMGASGDRRLRLAAAGYDADAVQRQVNIILLGHAGGR